MFDLDVITGQVSENCAICDSRHAGLYSVCGLALRLRDLYKWEKGLEPWVEKESSEVLEWIGEKEEKWDLLGDKEFAPITISGIQYDPFEAGPINAVLQRHGLFYGAGYVHSLRPTFFLAVLEGEKEVSGLPVFVLGRELARDLFTVPALSQGDFIVLRKESAKLFLWDSIFFVKKSGRAALKVALGAYGLKENDQKGLQRLLANMSEVEMETYMYHELGEMKDTIFDRHLWRNIISTFHHTPIELLARAVKDLLADTNEYGTLHHIVKKRRTASLAFYAAFFDGLRKELFPELMTAFQAFTESQDWRIVEEAVCAGYHSASRLAETISSIYREGKRKRSMKWAKREMERRLLFPLGILKEA